MRGMYSKLPHNVTINNEKFIINTDFRIFVDFEYEMQEIDRNKAVNKVLNRFYPAFSIIVENGYIEEAIDKFLWFYRCGREENETYISKKSNKKSIYSYKYDDLYIWGSFHMYHKVDLTRDKIHWWKFRGMWNTIPSESEFSKIKSYRAYTGKDKNILDLQEQYKLPKTQIEIENQLRRKTIYDELLKGG